MVNSMDFFQASDQEVDTDGDPDLGLHGVFACAMEGLDAQVLLDPLEEELDIPPAFVDGRDHQCGQCEIVGQKDQGRSALGINESNPTELIRVEVFALSSVQANRLIATQPTGTVDRSRFDHIEAHVFLGPGDEEGPLQMDAIQTHEINIGTVHDIDASRFDGDVVKEVDIMHLSVCDADEHWDRAAQLHLRVHLDRRFRLTECCPGKHRKTQINGGGIQCVDDFIQVQFCGVIVIQTPSLANEDLRQIGVNLPRAVFVGICNVCSCNIATDTHRVKVGTSPQACFNVTKALPESHLSECHRQKLISSTEAPADSRHRVALQATLEFLAIQQINHLGEDEAALIHGAEIQSQLDAGSDFKCVTR